MQPAHYTQGPIHCIDAMVSAFGKHAVRTYCIINSFKYIWRCTTHPAGVTENMQKAIWFCQKANELG
jgi:hypothetical protein